MRLLKNVYTKIYRQRFSGNKCCVGIQIASSHKRKTKDIESFKQRIVSTQKLLQVSKCPSSNQIEIKIKYTFFVQNTIEAQISEANWPCCLINWNWDRCHWRYQEDKLLSFISSSTLCLGLPFQICIFSISLWPGTEWTSFWLPS